MSCWSRIGEDPEREGLQRTPARVARAYAEAFAGLQADPDVILSSVFDEGHEEMVIVKDIELSSSASTIWCRSTGYAHVGYIPNAAGQITGLSKLARLIDVFAKRPQVQERLTDADRGRAGGRL